jgi:hypothetical protein
LRFSTTVCTPHAVHTWLIGCDETYDLLP